MKVEAHSAIIYPFGLSGFMNEENPKYLLVPDFRFVFLLLIFHLHIKSFALNSSTKLQHG